MEETEMMIEAHSHTRYSDGAINVKAAFVAARLKGLDGIIVSDHDTTKHQKPAMEMARRMGMFTLPAVEITAENGAHILGYGIEELPARREMYEIVDFIRSSGGIAVAAHPFGDHHAALTVEGFDAAEINGSVMQYANIRVRIEAITHGIPLTGGSDAHTLCEIGGVRMEFSGDFLKAVKHGRAIIHGKGLGALFPIYKIRRRIMKRLAKAGMIRI